MVAAVGQGGLGEAQVGGARGEPVQAAVDGAGHRFEIVAVRERVDVPLVPIDAGQKRSPGKQGGLGGIGNEVETEHGVVSRVVRPARDLDEPAALEPLAVARLGVAEVMPAFVGGA